MDMGDDGYRGASFQNAPLCWRMDPSESFSDWTIHVKRTASDGSSDETKTYHVHRSALALGPRGSPYFSAMFQMPLQENSVRSSFLEFDHDDQVKAFELFLDAMYHGMARRNQDRITITGDIVPPVPVDGRGRPDPLPVVNPCNKHTLCLADLSTQQLWELSKLIDYFSVTILQDQLYGYLSEYYIIDLDEEIKDLAEFSILLSEFKSKEDIDFRIFFLPLMYVTFTSYKWGPGFRMEGRDFSLRVEDADTRKINNECHQHEVCRKKLKLIVPALLDLLQHRWNKTLSASKAKFQAQTYEKVKKFVKKFPVEVLVDSGILKMYFDVPDFDRFDEEDEEVKCRLAEVICDKLNGSDECRDVLLKEGAMKSLSEMLAGYNKKLVESGELSNIQCLAKGLLSSKKQTPQMDHIIDFIPALDYFISKYARGHENKRLFYDFLELFHQINEMSTGERWYIVDNCNISLWSKVFIHPDIQGSKISFKYTRQPSDLLERKKRKREHSGPIDRRIVLEEIVKEDSIARWCLKCYSNKCHQLVLRVLIYLCQGPEDVISDALTWYSEAERNEYHKMKETILEDILQLVHIVLAHSTDEHILQLMNVRSSYHANESSMMTFILFHFLKKKNDFVLNYPPYIMICMEAVERSISAMEEDQRQRSAEYHFGTRMRLLTRTLYHKIDFVNRDDFDERERVFADCLYRLWTSFGPGDAGEDLEDRWIW